MTVRVLVYNDPAPAIAIDFEVPPRAGEKIALAAESASGDHFHTVLASWHENSSSGTYAYAVRVAPTD